MSLACLEMRPDEFCFQRPRCCYTTFSFEYKTSVVCHNVYTQKVKLARRDRPHILASNRCETFKNLLHIDIAPSRDFTLKKLNDDFYRYQGPMTLSIYIYITSLYRTTWKMCKFNRTLYNTQLIQFALIPSEFVVRFIRYQYRVKLMTFSLLLSIYF